MKKEAISYSSELAEAYDGIMFNPATRGYFGNSDFMNFGYWDQNIKDQRQACENLMEKLLSFIPDKRGNILDVACGKGGTTRYLLKYYPSKSITGINISEKQLETAKANAPGCTFLAMDATELKFETNSFDNILCVEAAFHFHTREKFLREAHRVLKPGGRIVLSDILMTREAEQRRRFRTEKNYLKDLKEYRNLLLQTGFQEIQIIDSTEQCWQGHFWNVVKYFHEEFFLKRIDQNSLYAMLENTYRVVPDIEFYLLASIRK